MQLLSSREILREAEAIEAVEHASAFLPLPLNREQKICEAVLLMFCEPVPKECWRLKDLSRAEWQRLLRWLDISGLALYFFHRVTELGFDVLPSFVLNRLQQNLVDNTQRTHGMIEESLAIQRLFQQADISYATLKGFSLTPYAVPMPELRHQFDLDFLVAEGSAKEARQILERRGYRLSGISGRSREFKINETPHISLKDFYKDLPGRRVELHLELNTLDHLSALTRTELRPFYGIEMPVLSPVDLFVGQGLHAYKDVCSEFSRASHLLEFRRHVLARCDDVAFWNRLRSTAEINARASLGLGVVVEVITQVMGEFAPSTLTCWTSDRLPLSAKLWIKRYGPRGVFKKHPGNKLYLLLQRELESAGVPSKRSLRKALLPSGLPPLVVKGAVGEGLRLKIQRYRLQFGFILLRLHFHVVEGLRYGWESRRWRGLLDRVSS